MRLLALLMACLLPVSTIPVASSPPAVRHLSTTGTVWINAAALPSGSSVYNGDTVATAESAVALLTSREGRVEIRPDTLVSVGEREIALNGGVVGSDGLAVRVGSELVRPSGGAASRPWFVVADRNGQKLVAAYSGSVLIASDGSEPIVVPEGFYAVPGDPPKEKTGSGLPGDVSSPGGSSGSRHWAIFSLTSGTAVAFIVSLGATAVFTSIVAYTLGQESVSPSN
jgi:hypothetical protein